MAWQPNPSEDGDVGVAVLKPEAKRPNSYSNPVALHCCATLCRICFPGFGGVLQENRATPPEKGRVAPTFSALKGGCCISSCLLEGVAVQGGVAATLSPAALQWGT